MITGRRSPRLVSRMAPHLAMARTALITLLSHYRRHPGQLAMLLVGLWVASALWSGVQAINASARDSYARAEALLSPSLERLERRDGEPLSYDDFTTLRRAGLAVSPLVEGTIELNVHRLAQQFIVAEPAHLDQLGVATRYQQGNEGKRRRLILEHGG